jgi:diguanylate cyclase (GGDEF)-like protein
MKTPQPSSDPGELLARENPANADLLEALDAMPDQVALLSPEGIIRFVNRSWVTFGLENGAVPQSTSLGIRYSSVCLSTNGEAVQNELAPSAAPLPDLLDDVLSGRSSGFEQEYPCHSPNALRWALLRVKPLAGGGAVVVHTDITAQKQAQLNLHEQAIRDPLTQLLNRRGLQTLLAAEVSRARRTGSPLSAILLDCDNFKGVNDTHGHATGDVVLREIAKRLCDGLRPEDVISRLGGDEFLVLLPETNISEAYRVAERLRITFSAIPVAVSHGPIQVTLSLSVVEMDEEVAGIDDLLRLSQSGLRQSKVIGKNHTATTGRTKKPEPDSLEWATSHLDVAVQEIRELHTQKPAAVEFLIRGPPGLYERPDDLFRSAMEKGCLGLVDRVTLQFCLKATQFSPHQKVHLNVYPSTLLSIEPEIIFSWLPTGILASDICLELCEQQILGDPAHLIPHLEALREFGFQIGIDDVGFGRSCLENLVVLEPDVIKIDRLFGYGVSTNPGKGRTLERLLRVATTLQAMVVVEGIESAADAKFIEQLGASHGQGFLWGKPSLLKIPPQAAQRTPTPYERATPLPTT